MAFQIRLLGELQLSDRSGRPKALPASKKTRALIGYLVATGLPHRRERLCDLLWEGPDDPRAELRWSLTKIRPLLNEPGVTRLSADRERVGFAAGGDAEVDVARVRELLAGDISARSVEELETAIGLLRGELLDGLDLPACYRYQEWCLAEREAVSRLRLAALSALVQLLEGVAGPRAHSRPRAGRCRSIVGGGSRDGGPTPGAPGPQERGARALRLRPPAA